MGTNDASSQAAITEANIQNTIIKLQSEGYDVVVVPPSQSQFGTQHNAAVQAG